MKTIRYTDTLDYYDGIKVFEGRDSVGRYYVGTMIDTVGGFDRYMVTGVALKRLRQCRNGILDLRTLLLEAPGGEWYIAVADGSIDDPLVLELQDGPLAETDFLPEPGFFLADEVS